MRISRTWKRRLALSWLALNVCVILHSNAILPGSGAWGRFARDHWDNGAVRGLQWSFWVLGWYPFLFGLDQRYQMFSTLHRSLHWYEIRALSVVSAVPFLLPIERQWERGFWLRNFVDHKAGKFHLNIYGNEHARRSYSDYLCRAFDADYGGIKEIRFESHFHEFVGRELAYQSGSHFKAPPYVWKTEVFPCRRP
jgi:hypothetical protein